MIRFLDGEPRQVVFVAMGHDDTGQAGFSDALTNVRRDRGQRLVAHRRPRNCVAVADGALLPEIDHDVPFTIGAVSEGQEETIAETDLVRCGRKPTRVSPAFLEINSRLVQHRELLALSDIERRAITAAAAGQLVTEQVR